jgi:hypothetical protein
MEMRVEALKSLKDHGFHQNEIRKIENSTTGIYEVIDQVLLKSVCRTNTR